MSRFLKSKLVLSLAALMIIAAAIVIPLSSSILHTHAQGTVTITEFPTSTSNSAPEGITTGPDGNLWFTEASGNQIGKITPNGSITEYPIPTSNSFPFDITTGPDGNLWFTEYQGNKIGKITPNGSITEYPIPPNSGSGGAQIITTGPDNNLWFTEAFTNKIGQITINGNITEFSTPTLNSAPNGIITGPDGNLWLTELYGNNIAKVTTNGNFTEYPIPTSVSYPYGITTGPDGNLWFAEAGGNKIGKITPSGSISEFSLPTNNSGPYRITTGPDNNLWFTRGWGNNIGKMTLDGTVTEYSAPNGLVRDITSGPDGNLWFAETAGYIGRVNLSSPTPSVTVQKVWTADGNGNTTTAFVPGDAIHYMALLNNSNSTTVTATVTVLATGPQQIYSSSISVPIAAGLSTYIVAATIPRTAPTGTYTITITVTYNGVSSSGQSQFTVTATTAWGVDSYDQITYKVPGYATLYDYVNATFGTPDFWGRYIGNVPGFPNDMDLTEAPFAKAHNLAILPIYFNYNETQVKGYNTGQGYALLAIEDAQQRLHISQGVAIFVDIEGKSTVKPDAKFIQGWYDKFNSTFTYTIKGQKYTYQAGYYKAGYYANTGATANFHTPFCTAVSNEPAIGTNSFIWTNQISHNITNQTFGTFSKASAPAYNPLTLSCTYQQIPIPAAWQYGLEDGSSSMVDVDEAQPSLPLWHPN